MHFARLTKSIALFMLTLGFAAPAHAQNNKPIRSGGFYEDRAQASVSNSSMLLTFAQAPTDKYLNITNISCGLIMNSQQILEFATLIAGSSPGANDLGRYYSVRGNVTAETASGTDKYFSIVQNGIFYKLGPGRYPSVVFGSNLTATSLINVNCVIVGTLTDN